MPAVGKLLVQLVQVEMSIEQEEIIKTLREMLDEELKLCEATMEINRSLVEMLDDAEDAHKKEVMIYKLGLVAIIIVNLIGILYESI